MYYRKEVIFQMKKQSKVTSQSAMLQQNTRSTYRILIISIVMLILFIGSNMYLSRSNSQQLEATMYLNQYRLGSKTLTAAVQSYAVTGDQTYYDNYMKELNEDKNRDIAWEGLQKDGLTDNEWALLNHIAEMSNGLVPLEEEAMDKAGSGDTQAAISYVFGEEYESTVQEITATTDNCINDIQARMAQKQNTLNLIMITTMVIFILCFLTIARKIVTTLTFAKQELLIPIVKVSEQMKVLAQGHFDSRLDLPEDDSEVGIMVQAVHFMNDNFTKMITEISEILGQMGQGNYRVEPTEEYVGDFVQIKDSMVKIIADMKKTLSTIQVSAQEIDGGSEQLAQAATDLAEGCTAQASKISEASQMIDAMAKSIEEKAFDTALDKEYDNFYNGSGNWNQVCNAGLVFGALAIYDKAPEKAQKIIDKCYATIPRALEAYKPDGTYGEGFMYWDYGTSFQAMLNCALETVGMTTFADANAFEKSAEYYFHMVGPSRKCFNYSDCSEKVSTSTAMFYFAAKKQDPSLLYWEMEHIKNNLETNRLLPSVLVYTKDLDISSIPIPVKKNLFWCRSDSRIFDSFGLGGQ